MPHPSPSTERPAPAPAARRAGFILRHPLLAFFAWFTIVGQAFALAPVILTANGIDTVVPFQGFIIASTLFGLLLPALAITGITGGRAAVRRMLASALKIRAGVPAYLLILGGVPLIAITLMTVLGGLPPQTGVLDMMLGYAVVFGVQLVLSFVPNNWAEEIAWTGFVQARLRERHSILVAALIAAPLFASQHLALVVMQGPVAGALLLVLLTVLVIPFRFLAGWMFERTGSLFAVGLLHAAGNAAAGGSGFGPGWSAHLWHGEMTAGFAHFLAYLVIAVPVFVLNRRMLVRR
jgi:membrane protease YdiL (CAAX protease family)